MVRPVWITTLRDKRCNRQFTSPYPWPQRARPVTPSRASSVSLSYPRRNVGKDTRLEPPHRESSLVEVAADVDHRQGVPGGLSPRWVFAAVPILIADILTGYT